MKKILLISMPYGALDRQALGLSMLKAQLNEEGIACDIRYLMFTFADLLGVEEYVWLMQDVPHTAFAGEWTFIADLYGEDRRNDARYIRHVLKETWCLGEAEIKRIIHARNLVPHFLDYCMATIEWQDYAMVGFTSTFEQNIASLALAKRIKASHPELATVFGGGNWEEKMGLELHRQFSFVDYVCAGEAENSFPLLVQRILGNGNGQPDLSTIKGLIYRSAKGSRYTGQADLITRMDELPIPDYSDYFDQFTASSAGNLIVPTLLFEGSRGCWWGAKSHCTFCGLNGNTLKFRAKSDARVLQEIHELVASWGIDTIQAVDNVLDMNYFKKLIPILSKLKKPIQFFYEVRASLLRQHVRLLAEAGIRNVQPGIESLNDHVLKLMRKGTTALQNIQFLKWCKEYGVKANWNILYGFPGENRSDYLETINLFPAIQFLDPPTSYGPIRLDRFSPYFNDPKAYGLTRIRPMPVYAYIYPFGQQSLKHIAYYFDYEYEPEKDPTGHAETLIRYVEAWREHPEKGELRSIQHQDGSLVLLDSRKDAVYKEVVLTGADRLVYEFCDKVRSTSAIMRHLEKHLPKASLTKSQIEAFLDTLVSHRLMVTSHHRYLSLALRSSPVGCGLAQPQSEC